MSNQAKVRKAHVPKRAPAPPFLTCSRCDRSSGRTEWKQYGQWNAWFQSCPDAVTLICFSSGKFADINTRCCDLMGYSREELMDRTIEELGLLGHPRMRHSLLEELAQSGYVQTYETEVRTRAGRVLQVQCSLQLLSINNQPHVLAIWRDLTSIRAAESELRSLSGAMEAAVEGIAFIDVHGLYTRVNQVYAEMLQDKPERIVGRSWVDTVHPDDLKDANVAYAQMLGTGKSRIEIRGIRQDKSVFDKQVTLIRIQGPNGSFAGHYRCTTDITSRKVRERAIAASESRLRTIWNSEPECVIVVNRSLAICDLNPAGLKMLDLDDSEQAQGRLAAEFVDPLKRDRVTAAIERAFEGESGSLEFEMLGAGGTRRWVESRIAPLHNGASQVEQALIISRDITKRRSAEAALRRIEGRYRDLLENANDIIFTIDAEGRFTCLNRAAELLLGYRRSELLNKPILSIIAQESLEDARRMLQAHHDGHCRGSVEGCVVLSKDGKQLLLDVSTHSVSEQLQFVGVQGIARDITERERI